MSLFFVKFIMLDLLKYGINQVETFPECIFYLVFTKYSKKATNSKFENIYALIKP